MDWLRFSNPLSHAEVASSEPRAQWWKQGVRDARHGSLPREDVPGAYTVVYLQGYEAEMNRKKWATSREVPGAFRWLNPWPDQTHDYAIEDDYEPDRRPSPLVKAVTTARQGDLEDLAKFLRLGKPSVYFVKNLSAGKHLAKYVNGTSSAPVIVLDARHIVATAKKYDVELDDGIWPTLVHEMGHAYVDSTGKELDREDEEKLVEDLAYSLWRGWIDPSQARAWLDERLP